MTAIPETPRHVFGAKDVLAGLSVALVLIPQSLAYAELAGLPGHRGLYAAALPPIAAALFASSPYLQTGPVALTSLLTFGALVPLAAVQTSEYVGLAALLALTVGAARVAIGWLRAGWVSYLLSRALLNGFTSAAAILIVMSQVPAALGGAAPDGGVLGRAVWTLAHPASWDLAALGLAVGTVLTVTLARRVHPLVPGVLLAALGGLAFSVWTDYPGQTVGGVPAGLPPLSLELPWRRLPSLVLPGFVIALVGFAETASIARIFAGEDRQRWDPDREFLSQGSANLVAGVTGGFPIGGSFSRSSINRAAGAQSRWSGLVAGVAVLLFLPISGVVAPLPTAILAGIVIGAVWKLFKPGEMIDIWRASPPQGAVAAATFGLTLFLSPHVEQAVVLGLLMAVVVHLWRERRPRLTLRREHETLHVELSGVLWFGSAPVLEERLVELLGQQRDVSRVVLDCSGLGRIDHTAALGLVELQQQLRSGGLDLDLVGIPDHARRIFRALRALEHGEPPPAAAGSDDGDPHAGTRHGPPS